MKSYKLGNLIALILIVSFAIPSHGFADDDHHDHDDHHEHHGHDAEVHYHGDDRHDAHDEEEHHGHAGLHGGYFADANDIYHVEFILEKNGKLVMYLMDGNAKPMKVTNIPATWSLAPENDYPLKGKFNESEDGEYYWVKFPEHDSEILHLQIHVKKEKHWPSLEYFLPVGKKTNA